MKRSILIVPTITMSLLSTNIMAKVDTEEADRLGKELTLIGAEKSANTAGTIPEYTGGLKHDANADPYDNIFKNENPLFVINKDNLEEYKGNLTSGQLAMFDKYPDTYIMPVYKTHRTASLPKSVFEKAKKNATTAQLLPGGNGLMDFDETVPFAIPQNGLEVIWNHVTRFRGGGVHLNQATLPVERNGDFLPIVQRASYAPPQYLKDGFNLEEDKNILFYYTSAVKSPSRLTGNVLLVHETINQFKEPRKAWQYNAGTRRVRRAPQVAYDAPNTSGMQTMDQVDMFNGSPDRYDWKLIGKKEIYIPYNAYKLIDKTAKYDEIIDAGHLDQSYTRYELHRVWKVEATLKEGARHIYGSRTLYFDEDTWQIALADHYDKRGELWRVSEGHAMQYVNANTPWYASITNYDLLSGRYVVLLSNEEERAVEFGASIERKVFTTAAIRRSGKR